MQTLRPSGTEALKSGGSDKPVRILLMLNEQPRQDVNEEFKLTGTQQQ